MRRTWFGLALIAGLSMPAAAEAADSTVVGVGTGAVAGAVVGGPIGAVVGAVAGGFIGANTASTRSHRRVRARHVRRASVPSPRARVAEHAAERVRGEAAAATASASEVSTQPRPATTGSTRSAPPAGWQDPH